MLRLLGRWKGFLLFVELKLSYSILPSSEVGILIALFWCSSTDNRVMLFVWLTSSGIFSSHFHWHKSLLYVIQFKLLNQKFYGSVTLAKRCWRECNIQLICGYISKDTRCHVMVLPWNSTMKCISVSCDSLWNFHNVLFLCLLLPAFWARPGTVKCSYHLIKCRCR